MYRGLVRQVAVASKDSRLYSLISLKVLVLLFT